MMTDTEANCIIDELVDLKAKLTAADEIILNLREDLRTLSKRGTYYDSDESFLAHLSSMIDDTSDEKVIKYWSRRAIEAETALIARNEKLTRLGLELERQGRANGVHKREIEALQFEIVETESERQRLATACALEVAALREEIEASEAERLEMLGWTYAWNVEKEQAAIDAGPDTELEKLQEKFRRSNADAISSGIYAREEIDTLSRQNYTMNLALLRVEDEQKAYRKKIKKWKQRAKDLEHDLDIEIRSQ